MPGSREIWRHKQLHEVAYLNLSLSALCLVLSGWGLPFLVLWPKTRSLLSCLSALGLKSWVCPTVLERQLNCLGPGTWENREKGVNEGFPYSFWAAGVPLLALELEPEASTSSDCTVLLGSTSRFLLHFHMGKGVGRTAHSVGSSQIHLFSLPVVAHASCPGFIAVVSGRERVMQASSISPAACLSPHGRGPHSHYLGRQGLAGPIQSCGPLRCAHFWLLQPVQKWAWLLILSCVLGHLPYLGRISGGPSSQTCNC